MGVHHMRSIFLSSLRNLLVFILATLAVPVAMLAQETVNSATVSSVVTDPSGAVVVSASVMARQTDTNLTSTTATDNQGRFRFTTQQTPLQIMRSWCPQRARGRLYHHQSASCQCGITGVFKKICGRGFWAER